jgi:hypothetical protein
MVLGLKLAFKDVREWWCHQPLPGTNPSVAWNGVWRVAQGVAGPFEMNDWDSYSISGVTAIGMIQLAIKFWLRISSQKIGLSFLLQFTIRIFGIFDGKNMYIKTMISCFPLICWLPDPVLSICQDEYLLMSLDGWEVMHIANRPQYSIDSEQPSQFGKCGVILIPYWLVDW